MALRPTILAEPGVRVPGLSIDSLPAIDGQLDEAGMRERVDELIIEEMKRMAGEERITAQSYLSGTRLHHFIDLATDSASALVRAELQRMVRGEPAESRVSPAAYSILTPPGDSAGPGEWESAVRRAEIALEAQTLRTINTELAAKYGVDTWRVGAANVEQALVSARTRAAALAQDAARLDAARSSAQAPHAARLTNLAKRYAEAVESNFATELACADAEREVKRLRSMATTRG